MFTKEHILKPTDTAVAKINIETANIMYEHEYPKMMSLSNEHQGDKEEEQTPSVIIIIRQGYTRAARNILKESKMFVIHN